MSGGLSRRPQPTGAVMANPAEIEEFIRLTRGLSSATLGKAIRRRWPKATNRDIHLAFQAADAPPVVRNLTIM